MFILKENSIRQVIITMNNQYWFCLATGILFSMPIALKVEGILESKKLGLIFDIMIVAIFVIAIAYLLGKRFSPFLYFRF